MNRKHQPQRSVAFVLASAVLSTLLAVVLSGAGRAADAEEPALVAGLTKTEALRHGEKMYRDGVLPSGETLQAVVKGDIPVDGAMFTCVSCHLRSGFGTGEGRVRTPPIDGTRLYSAISKVRGAPLVNRPAGTGAEGLYRPGYTDETLARVIQTGEDPAGRQVNDAMPKYFLGDRDAAIMAFYLKNLSTEQQPGVTDTTIRFATIVSDDAPAEVRRIMLTSLQNFVDSWRLPRSMERGMRASLYRQEGIMRNLRRPALSVWELRGPAETWRSQLEEYYRNDPVFAFLGGVTSGEWSPIHRFCEDHRIPAVFPLTDFPVLSETDWYTLYLSRGLAQEGEAAARYLHDRSGGSNGLSVVQVYRAGPAGLALSRAFRDTWVSLGHTAPEVIALRPDEPVPGSFRDTGEGTLKDRVVLLWLEGKELPGLELLVKGRARPAMIFASSSLLGRRMYEIPDSGRGILYLTYPHILPRDSLRSRRPSGSSPQAGGVPAASQETLLKMHALVQTISGPLARMRSFVYRDHFLELIESTPDLRAMTGIYPSMSFGAGQRYASKGCYIVQLSDGPQPMLVARSEWVIP